MNISTQARRVLGVLVGLLFAGCAAYAPTAPYDSAGGETRNLQEYAALTAANYRYSAGVASAYYPWWSVDYFYLGYHAYRPFYHPVHSWGHWHYPPWHYRGHGSSYAWDWPYRHRYPRFGYVGFDSYWHFRYRQQVFQPRTPPPQPVGSHGGQLSGPGYRPGIEDGISDRETMRRGRAARRGGAPGQAGAANEQAVNVVPRKDGGGMVVVGGRHNKVGPNRPEPVRSGTASGRSATTSAPAPSVRPAARGRPASQPTRSRPVRSRPARPSSSRSRAGAARRLERRGARVDDPQ